MVIRITEEDKTMALPFTISARLNIPSINDKNQIHENGPTPVLLNQEKPQEKYVRFPEKVFNIITNCDKNKPDVAGWSPNGQLMIIRDKMLFEKCCISVSFESFIRQLHMYGFKKMNDMRSGRKTQGMHLIFRHRHFRKNLTESVIKIQIVKKGKKDKAKNAKKKIGCVMDNRKTKIKTITSGTTSHLAENANNRLTNLEDKIVDIQKQLKDISFKFEVVLEMIASKHTIPLKTENVTENKTENNKRNRKEMTGHHIHSYPIVEFQSPSPISEQEDSCPDSDSYHLDFNPPRKTTLTSNNNDRRNQDCAQILCSLNSIK